MTDNVGYGQQDVLNSYSDYAAIRLVVRQMLAQLAVMCPVKVTKVSSQGGLSESGTVTVQPLVTMLDGKLQAMNHAEIFNMQYFRLQGGKAAVIMDPKVGDIGFCVFADRDISVVVKKKEISQPGSLRQHSFSDGIYIGGILNDVPEKYVIFDENETKIVDPVKINVMAPVIELNGAVTVNGTVSGPGNVINIEATLNLIGDVNQTGSQNVTGGINASNDVIGGGIHLAAHVHSGVISGPNNSGPPVV